MERCATYRTATSSTSRSFARARPGLGIKPGERVDFEKLPNGELRVRAARPIGTIDGFLHSLDGKVKLKEPLSIEDMNRIAAAGWAGKLDQA